MRDGGAAPIALRMRLGGGPLPPGKYAIEFPLEAGAGEGIHAELAGGQATLAAPARSTLTAEIVHAGGRLALTGSVSVPDGGSLWLAAPRIVTRSVTTIRPHVRFAPVDEVMLMVSARRQRGE